MKQPTVNDYIYRLKSHDWYYEYSDDHVAWRRGRDERKVLEDLRFEFDKDYTIWNQWCGIAYRRKDEV